MAGKPKDMHGMKVGLLQVHDISHRNSNGDVFWNCTCDCGNKVTRKGAELRRPRRGKQSCGCFLKSEEYSRILSERLSHEEGGWKAYYKDYRRDARTKGREFSLNFDEFKKLASRACEYCGAAPYTWDRHQQQRHRMTLAQGKHSRYLERDDLVIRKNGIDRVDSRRGYVVDNCVPCCTTCNSMKLSHTKDNWLSHIRQILKHQEEQNAPSDTGA